MPSNQWGGARPSRPSPHVLHPRDPLAGRQRVAAQEGLDEVTQIHVRSPTGRRTHTALHGVDGRIGERQRLKESHSPRAPAATLK